jgi:hypothetical protein
MAKVPTAAAQLTDFMDRFAPEVVAVFRGARARLRRQLPTAIELVYDNYNFLVIGYCAAPRASTCIVSLAASAKGVVLSFYYGASLPDPKGVLLGSGKQNRFVRLPAAATLAEPAVQALIKAAVAQARTPLPAKGRTSLVIQSISAKQRPRRKPSK